MAQKIRYPLWMDPKLDSFLCLSAVRHSPQSGQASVYVANSPKKDFYTTSVIKDAKWSNLPDSFQQVNIEKMDGKNLLNKIELLMAALTPLNKE